MATKQWITYGPDGSVVESRSYETAPEQDNRDAMLDSARQALATNRTYIGLASPTAAQNVAQMKALSRQNNGLIRLLLGLLDGTD